MAPGQVRDVDRRVQRSRHRLHEALVALVLDRGWDRVTVQAVCDRARVGRSTFYVHFADKEELLVGGLDHVRDELRRQRRAARAPRPFGFARGLIEHADGSRRLFRGGPEHASARALAIALVGVDRGRRSLGQA